MTEQLELSTNDRQQHNTMFLAIFSFTGGLFSVSEGLPTGIFKC